MSKAPDYYESLPRLKLMVKWLMAHMHDIVYVVATSYTHSYAYQCIACALYLHETRDHLHTHALYIYITSYHYLEL